MEPLTTLLHLIDGIQELDRLGSKTDYEKLQRLEREVDALHGRPIQKQPTWAQATAPLAAELHQRLDEAKKAVEPIAVALDATNAEPVSHAGTSAASHSELVLKLAEKEYGCWVASLMKVALSTVSINWDWLREAVKKEHRRVLGVSTTSSPPASPIVPSDDYTSVQWGTRMFYFSPGRQAKSVEALLNAYNKGGQSLHEKTIRTKIQSEDSDFRLAKVFRVKSNGSLARHPALGTMIVHAGAGCWRIVAPAPKRARRNPA